MAQQLQLLTMAKDSTKKFKHRNRWSRPTQITDADRRKARKLSESGKSVEAISKTFGVSDVTVYKWLRDGKSKKALLAPKRLKLRSDTTVPSVPDDSKKHNVCIRLKSGVVIDLPVEAMNAGLLQFLSELR